MNVLLFFLLHRLFQSISGIKYDKSDLLRRKLIEFHPQVDRGNSSFVSGITVFGAVVRLPIYGHEDPLSILHTPSHQQEFNIEKLKLSLPFPLVIWPAVGAKTCPAYSLSPHRIENGKGLSHYQVWIDFVFFDHDVLEARYRPKPEYVSSTSYSSISGHFQAFSNHTLYKNDLLYLDEDILVVLEDNVHIIHIDTLSDNLRFSLTKLKSALDTIDLLRLSKTPHYNAYAMTRKAARKLIRLYDVCGHNLGMQLQSLNASGLLYVDTVEESLFRVHDVISTATAAAAAKSRK
jgi:hypothetical protein